MFIKKTALIAGALVLSTASAWAYENPAAGFSVKDKDPFYRMESSKLYAYSDFSTNEFAKLANQDSASVHIVNHYNAGDMHKILGQSFSTTYFEAEYEKLALLKRAELDMRTVPSPLLDMNKYQAVKADGAMLLQKELFTQSFGKLQPMLRIDKLGKLNVITESYLYKQSNNLVEVDISLLSCNNNLYMLTSVTTDSKYYADKKTDEEKKAQLKNHVKLEAVAAKDLPVAVTKKLWQKHLQFVKGFKAFQPALGKQELQYTDKASGKSMRLPSDWIYGQVQFKEKAASGCLTLAAPVANLKRIFGEIDYLGLYNVLDTKQEPAADVKASNDVNIELPQMDAQAKKKAKVEARKALHNFDSVLMTLSYTTKDKDFQDLFEQAVSNSLVADAFLGETLKNLKKHSSGSFILNSYDYKVDFTATSATANIKANVSLLKDYTYDSLLRLVLNKTKGSALLYAHKPTYATNADLAKSIEEWQF